MYKDIRIGSIFISMNQRVDQPWRRDIIVGDAREHGRCILQQVGL